MELLTEPTFTYTQPVIFNLDTTIMVGDRMHDVHGAAKFGIDTIGVTFGYGSYEELSSAGAKVIVNTVEELTKELLK